MYTDNPYSEYDKLSLVELVREMKAVQSAKESAEAVVKELNKKFDFLRITKIPQVMEDEGIPRLTVEGVGRVSLTADMHVSVREGQKEAFYDWLRDNGREDLSQPTVNSSTLKATVKNMVVQGEEYPQELLNVSPFTRASITKG